VEPKVKHQTLATLPSLTAEEVFILRAFISSAHLGLLSQAEPDVRRRLERLADAPYRMTPREIDVTALVVDGLTNKQIAAKLGISHRTVETYRLRAIGKVGAPNALAFVRQIIAITDAGDLSRTARIDLRRQ
jgi:DNA-binding CsgD family transcriptional regulator